ANGCTGSANYTLVINCPSITVNPATLPNGIAGTAYNQILTAMGGTTPYTFTVSAGALPTGLTLASGGALTGTPTAVGTFNFTIKATDANGCIGTQSYTVTINCSFAISPLSQNFTAAGGSGSVTVTTQASCTWTAVSNDAWITLTGSGGTGSGS